MTNKKNIDFRNIKVSKVFHNKTKQYETFTKMNESSWSKYVTTMLSNNIRVKYDAITDAYTATPLKENEMTNKKYLLQDEDEMSTEQDALELINAIDLEDEEMEDEEMEVSNPEIEIYEPETPAILAPETVASPTIDMAQLEMLLNKILGKSEASMPEELPQQEIPIEGHFTGNILDTEFQENSDNLSYIESKIDAGSYMGSIDPNYDNKMMPEDGEMSYDVSEEGDEEELLEYENSEMEHFGSSTGELKEANEESDEEWEEKVANILSTQGIEIDSDMIDDFIEFEVENFPSLLQNPKKLIAKYIAYSKDSYTDGGDDLMEADEDEDMGIEAVDTEEEEPITANGMANVNGQAVQIILTGVMISPKEVSFVAESAKKAGMKLKAVKGAGTIVNFIVENAGKQYTIQYEDLPKHKSKTPFSIKKYSFTTLDEALNIITLKKSKALKEAKNFKTFMTKDISNRSFSNITESNILKEFEGKISKDYIAGWNVKAVGSINLKSGINETYSNITEHSNQQNTLVKTKDGQFFLLKGNLKERSEIGTIRQLVDVKGDKDYGTATVVGLYENSTKGLGQIMFKVKRTSLPLLTWK